jgi:hypothetical protein
MPWLFLFGGVLVAWGRHLRPLVGGLFGGLDHGGALCVTAQDPPPWFWLPTGRSSLSKDRPVVKHMLL